MATPGHAAEPAAGLLEFVGFHQLLAVERFRATIQAILRNPPTWGAMRRSGLPS